jgi:hypothetical protein
MTSTVRRWIQRFNREGIAGPGDRPRSGRPRLDSPRLEERLRRRLAEPRTWTVARLWRGPHRGELRWAPLHGVPSAPDHLRGHRAGPRASVTTRATSAGFLGLLERMVAAYPSAPAIAIPLDNHPPLPSGHPLAGGAPGPARLRPPLLPTPPPGGADSGSAEDVSGQHPGGDHGRSGGSGAGLLWGAQPGATVAVCLAVPLPPSSAERRGTTLLSPVPLASAGRRG